MKNKAILEEIAKNATIVEYHIKRLKKKPDQLHEIDIDLLTEKLKRLYSLVHELETDKAISFPKQEIVETAEVDESGTEDAVSEEVLVEKETAPEMIVEVSEKAEEVETVAPVEELVKDEKVVEPERSSELVDSVDERQEPQAEADTKPKTTADLFTGTPTIADSLKKEEDTSIAAKGRQQPLDDLKKAIGINDKFLFINELFKGDPANYNNVIDKLNTAEAITDASNLMNGYMKEYAWLEDGAAYQRLAKLLEAKFS